MGLAQPLLVVLGPTGSGKSDLALEIAQNFDGEIVNCDSLQMYRRFDIGTAKLPQHKRRGIPHHLIDALEPTEVVTAGEYVRVARPILREIASRGKFPVVAGGTGFYLRALLHGLFAGPERDESLRARLSSIEMRRPGFLHRVLRGLDPDSAGRIHPNDRNKLIRAVEVCVAARIPMTTMFAAGRDPIEGFRCLKIGLDPPREVLYERLNERCTRMWSGGLLREVQAILASGVPEVAKPFESIGYKQALNFIKGRQTEAEAIEEMRRDTRRYAKRQMTWFRKKEEVVWYKGFGQDERVVCPALDTVNTHLQVV